MSDLNVVALLKAKAGSEAILQQALSSLVQPSRAEAGCISYELFRSTVDATTFIMVERWQSHMKTPHIAQALRAAADAFEGAPVIHPLTPVSD
jgi:quinol monooxygenase YgiN